MTRSKFNKIIDEAVDLKYKFMEKINEILKDEKFIKKGGYLVESVMHEYSDAAEHIEKLQSLKADESNATIDFLFGLNNSELFEEEKED